MDLSSDGAVDTTLDFGFVRSSVSVGSFVWEDKDRDGIQDAGEAGIPGIVFTITDPDGHPVTDVFGNTVTSVTTDATGAYMFTDLPSLPAGKSYTVTLDTAASAAALTGYTETTAGAGTDPAKDSSTGSAVSIVDLSSDGAVDTTLDFGFYKASVSVGDFVWLDANRNGIQDAGEFGIPGVVLTISGPNGAAVKHIDGTSVDSVTTDASGAYLFTDLPVLPAGKSYTVTVDTASSAAALTGLIATSANTGSDTSIDSSSGSAATKDLTTDGDADRTLDFGFMIPAPVLGQISGLVWEDKNKDGIRESDELPKAGVTVQLLDQNDTVIKTVMTDATGRYLFESLPEGKYRVKVILPSDATITSPNQGTDANVNSDISQTTKLSDWINLIAGGNVIQVDAGFYKGTGELGAEVTPTPTPTPTPTAAAKSATMTKTGETGTPTLEAAGILLLGAIVLISTIRRRKQERES